MLKQTRSLCPQCRQTLDATVFARNDEVYMEKTCPEHGDFEVLVSSDERFYHLSVGAGDGETTESQSCCSPAPEKRNGGGLQILGQGSACCADVPESLAEHSSTCIALIEIVTSCNLKCPTCYADSPFLPKDSVDALSLEDFDQRIASVVERKGEIDVLQLSGGEPTIHPRFFDLLVRAWDDPRIGYLLLNTNGVRLARDEEFAARLGELYAGRKGLEIYLQFDGPQEAGQTALRGADLRQVREQAIDACAEHGIPVTLAMTVNEETIPHLGDTLRFGLARRNVRGITFQPAFTSGRFGGSRARPLNVADVVLGLIDQSDGLLSEKDFTPLPCGDPNCHTVGYAVRREDRVLPVSDLVDFASMQSFLKDRVDFNLEDLARCGCESEPLGQALQALEIGPDDVFRLFLKPFMDAWTYDQDRIDRCCVHVIGENGRLDSFCRHYALRA